MTRANKSAIRHAIEGLGAQENADARLEVKRLPVDCSPTELFLRVQEQHEYAYLLESMTGPEKLAQFSFIGFTPRLVVTAKDGNVTLQSVESNENIGVDTEDPIGVVEAVFFSRVGNDLKTYGTAQFLINLLCSLSNGSTFWKPPERIMGEMYPGCRYNR